MATQTITITGPVTYADLVDFVNRIGNVPANIPIKIKEGRMYSPLDRDPDSLSITFTVGGK